MKNLVQSFEIINKFFHIQAEENFSQSIFGILKELVDFESGYIFYTNPERLIYSYNPKIKNISEIKGEYLKENLLLKNTQYGTLIITGKNFTDYDREIFKTCALIIAGITKDIEISKIIKIQLETLQNINSEIRKSEEVKSKFLSHVSHELRTPLNSIIGFSDLLDSEFTGTLNNKQKEYVNDIKIASIHLLGMVNEILDMSKIESGTLTVNMSEFNSKTAVDEVINTLKPLILAKKLNIVKDIENITLKSDYLKFQQIIFNLVSNSVKYTPENGEIKISLGKEKNKTILCVEDNGTGIDKKYHKKIFEKFEQAGQHKNSTGLGLAITKELVSMLKGKIKLESELQKGAKFTIILP